MDHLLLMIWHALLVSVFFAFLWRSSAVGRRNLFLKTFLIMVVVLAFRPQGLMGTAG